MGKKVDVRTKVIDEVSPQRKGKNPHLNEVSCAVLDGWAIRYQLPANGRRAGFGLFYPDGTKTAVLLWNGGLASTEGWLYDNINVAEILLTCPNLHIPGTESVNGHPCTVVEGTSPDYGSYAVWIDPGSKSYARKLTIRKSPDNLFDGKKMKDWHFLPGRVISDAKVVSFEVELDNVEFVQAEEMVLPKRCRIVDKMQFTDGNHLIRRYESECTKIDLHPVLDIGAFVPLLETGATLANQQDLTKPYRWRDGKPVPKSTLPTTGD